MNPIKAGHWRIQSVEVNSQPASDNNGFVSLISTPDEIRVEPAGITFDVQQATARSAVLQSRSQVFYADFFTRGEQLILNLSRPSFSEKVSFKATFEPAMSSIS